MVFSHNVKLLATSGKDRYIKLWQIENDSLVEFQNLRTGKNPIKQISFSPDGKYLISLEERGDIEVWKKEGNSYSKSSLLSEYNDIESFSFSAESIYIAFASYTSVQILEYNENNFEKVSELNLDIDVTTATDKETAIDLAGEFIKIISFSPNSKYIAIGHNNRSVSLWNWRDNTVDKFEVPSKSGYGSLSHLSFSSQGNFFIAMDDDFFNKSLKVWKLSGNQFYSFQTEENLGMVSDIMFSPNENYLAIGSWYGAIIMAKNTGSKYEFKLSESIKSDFGLGNIKIISFSPDGQYLACGTEKGEIMFYRINNLYIPLDEFVKVRVSYFLEKDEYESTQEYDKRIKKYLDIKVQEIVDYALTKGYKIEITDISAYNADKKIFTLNFKYCRSADVNIKRRYAKNFKNNLNQLLIKNPQIKLEDGELKITYAEVYNPNDNKTFLIGEKSFFIYDQDKDKQVYELTEDDNYSVDIDIPLAKKMDKNALAIIFGIENYRNISKVSFAYRDASCIREYFIKTIGIPQNQIYFKTDDKVTLGEFNKVFAENGWLDKRVKKELTNIYIYYAGHGAPSIKEKQSYLIPYDGDINYPVQTGYPLDKMLKNLGSLNAKSVTVFLDACFSGINRDNEILLAGARPISIEVKKPYLSENVTIYSATSGNEISSAYPDKKHGLFTYFLLKGLQGSADVNNDNDLTVQELFDFLKSNVSETAGMLDREQTPELQCINPERVIVNY